MPITIDGNGTIGGASTLSTTVVSPTFTTPNINSAQFATVTGTAPLYSARAWVNFNGTGTVAIRASGNVSSITDNGVGQYTVNFTTAMPDANYGLVATASGDNATGDIVVYTSDVSFPRSASSIHIISVVGATGGVFDSPAITVSIFR